MKKFIDYLNNFRSVGGIVTNDFGDFNEAGLKIALSNAKVFFNSFSDLLKLSNIDLNFIEKLDIDLPMTEIGNLFLKHNSDKSKNHRYDLIYQNIFNNLQFNQLNILEIGSYAGASAAAFTKYLPKSKIYCFDVNISNFKYKSEKINVF